MVNTHKSLFVLPKAIVTRQMRLKKETRASAFQKIGGESSIVSPSPNVSQFNLLTILARRGTTLFLLKQTAKPSAQRIVRKKYEALDFKAFAKDNAEEEKKSDGDEPMADDGYRDVTDQIRKSKRNRT